MSPLVSIIVPVYNAQSSITKCVESILNQTEKNFEVILVDDGSEDSSLKICTDFCNANARIKVIHQENSGVSTARNAGINIAGGEWITFIDSDDYVGSSYLQDLIAAQKQNDADIAVAGYTIVNEKLGKIERRKAVNTCMGIRQFVEKIDEWEGFFNGPFAKLFRSSIVHKNGISFPANVHIGEDKIFCSEYLNYCKRLSFTDSTEYFYVVGNVGTLSSKKNLLVPKFNFRSAELRTQLRESQGDACGDVEYQKQLYNTLIFNFMRVFSKNLSYSSQDKFYYCSLLCNDETVQGLIRQYNGYNAKTSFICFLMKKKKTKLLYLLWRVKCMKNG